MADVLAIAVGVAVFAALCGGYAYLQSLRAAGERLARERLARETRPRLGNVAAIGGVNRPGEN